MFGTKTKEYLQCEWLLLLGRAIISSSYYNLSTPSSNKRSVENKMASGVFITRRGSGSSLGRLITETYTSNTTYTVPYSKSNMFYVRIFGGGSGGSVYRGGSGGFMNFDSINIEPGTKISIQIGPGGGIRSSMFGGGAPGGPTTFGFLLSASGGGEYAGEIIGDGMAGAGSFGAGIHPVGFFNSANSGKYKATYFKYARGASQFGGGAHYYAYNGGLWGGGGGGQLTCELDGSTYVAGGGDGGTYGGGGGGGIVNDPGGNTPTTFLGGGTGGVYGGGGGSALSTGGGQSYRRTGTSGAWIGLGGNGGNNTSSAKDGTDVSSWTNIIDKSSFKTTVAANGGISGGGGGFGGNGGNGATNGGGGGGGYGSRGGNGGTAGGGGGGYYGKGGDNHGGGGGYLGNGGTGNSICAGGGGAWGNGGSWNDKDGKNGGGGCGSTTESYRGNGGNGICIIQYYV